MRWIISKGILCGAILVSFGAVAQVPVTDKGTKEEIVKVDKRLEVMDERLEVLLELTQLQVKVISESGQSNLEMLKSNSKALTNINQALANVIVGTAKGQSQAVEMRRNADLYDEKMGAKPSSVCGVLDATIAISSGEQKQGETSAKMTELGQAYIERSRYLSPDQTLEGDRAVRVLALRKREQDIEAVVGPLSVISDKGLPMKGEANDDVWVVLHAKMMNMAIPTPVQIDDTSEDLNQPISEIIQNSAKLIQIDRQEMINDVISENVASRTKVYDASWVKGMGFEGENNTIGIPQRVLDEIDQGISETDTFRILSNYRLTNPQWMTTTMGKSNEVALLRDANLINAQQLQLLHRLYVESKQTNLLLAYVYGHQIEKSGVPNPSSSLDDH